MKKIVSLVLFTLAASSLYGCSTSSRNRALENIVRIKATGDMTKKHYQYNDSWSLKGLSCIAVCEGKKEITLNSDEFTASLEPSKPAKYNGSLTVKFTYKLDKDLVGTLTFDDLSVDVPDWDFDEEKEEYYEDADLTKKGTSLLEELHTHSFEKHTKFVTYGSVRDYKEGIKGFYSTDLIPGESKMELFFTGKHTNFTAGNKEHIWAAADSAGLWPHDDLTDGYTGGGSDLYHVRPVSESINKAHGDGEYVDSISGTYRSLGDGGLYQVKFKGLNGNEEYCSQLEVDKRMRGDLARIIAYVYMHYKSMSGTPSKYSRMVGSLSLTQVMGYSSESECKKKLISWNKNDPASEVEKYRNHTVQLIQGNRNPFVDYPDLMEKVFAN